MSPRLRHRRHDGNQPCVKLTGQAGDSSWEQQQLKKTSVIDRIKYQLEFLGYTDIIVPKTDKNNYYVTNLNGNWLTLYQLKTGITVKIKTRAKVLESNPVEIGDAIKIVEIKKEPRYYKDQNGNWQRDYENLEDILKRFQVLKK